MLSGHRVRLGYGAGTALTSVAQVREEAAWASHAGFESFWVSQVFGVDPIVALAAIGDAVPALREMGTSVVPLTGRHPLALAALGPRMLRLAGRVTAGTTVGSCGPRTIATHIAPTINEAADRAHRPQPRIVALVSVCVTDDPATVRARGWDQTRMYDSFPSYRQVLDQEGVESGADLILAGSIDDIVEGLGRYVDAGATDLRIMIAAGNDDERLATREALTVALAR